MLTLKVVCPQEQTADLLSRLDSDSAVLNLMVHTAKSHRPQGEMIEFDIVPEAGNRIIAMLRSMDKLVPPPTSLAKPYAKLVASAAE